MEAMRAGVPIVLTDVVGNRDAVEDGLSGFVVAPEDPDALAEAMLRLLDDDALRARMGRAARDRVGERFDVRVVAQRLAAVYDQACTTRRPVRS
jgi:glycosyltransferase involved in cell wall biosynthesis